MYLYELIVFDKTSITVGSVFNRTNLRELDIKIFIKLIVYALLAGPKK